MRKLINRLSREERGFTLIELLVVVAIIGILLTVAAPKVLDSLGKARESKGKANVAVLQAAIEEFRGDYGQYPATLKLLKDRGYVKDGFDFKNGYGKFYFYAVEANASGSSFSKYVLADPGNTTATAPTTDNNAAPAQTAPTEGLDPGATPTQILTFGTATGAAVQQAIDYNHDGDKIDTGETVIYSDGDAIQYANVKPTKNTGWTAFDGAYASENDKH